MNRKFDEITALKGLAILLVTFVHSAHAFGNMNEYLKLLTSIGRWGCQLFFVISGFLLCVSWNTKKKKNSDFLKARAITIIPSYYIAILLYFILNLCFVYCFNSSFFYSISNNPTDLLLNFIMLHSFKPSAFNFCVPGGWYIGTIWIMYLCFPLFMKLYNSVEYKCIIPILFGLLSFFIQLLIGFIHGDFEFSRLSSWLYYSPLNQMPCFLVGINLGYKFADGSFCNKSNWKSEIVFTFIYGCFATFMFYFLRNVPLIYTIVPVVYSYAFCHLIIFVFITREYVEKLLIWRVMISWGKVSFAAYYTNFFAAWMLPWMVINFCNIKIDHTLLYIITLIPMFILTYYLAKVYDILLAKITNKIKNQFYRKKLSK